MSNRGSLPRGLRRSLTVSVLAAALTASAAGPAVAVPTESSAARIRVIVQELPGAGSAAELAVSAVGGSVDHRLQVIGAFTAEVPADRVDVLRAAAGVRAVTEDAAIHLASSEVSGQAGQSGSLDSVTEVIGATAMWSKGYTGKGIDVAVLDSGVVQVPGLSTPGKVVHGPDLSFDAQQCADGVGCIDSPAYGLDGFGHGTAMAGIIAGRDATAPAAVTADSGNTDFLGVAPDARIVSVKVADATGAADVSQVIAGIDWVVQNRRKNGLNIRVLNLSFGTDGVQSYLLDPLTYAAEVAWRNGVVVVVSAGNRGSADGKLTNPAYDPFLLAVGAVDDRGTKSQGDDVIPSWSSRGDGVRNPDLVAPGAGVVSLRSPGAFLDSGKPGARVGQRFFRGSGTSQAAAVVSGSVALLLSQRPAMTADQVKKLLIASAKRIVSADSVGQGHGLVNLGKAMTQNTPAAASATQKFVPATGLGSLEASRGSAHVLLGGVELSGETDVTGAAWRPALWAAASTLGTSWSDGAWSGARWSGGNWNGGAWFGHTYNAAQYAGQVWDGSAWTSAPWSPDPGSSDGTWAASTWAASTWAASTWAASTWAASTWAASTWAASTWAASTWG